MEKINYSDVAKRGIIFILESPTDGKNGEPVDPL